MSNNFIQRPKCQLCGSDKKAILFSESFAEGEVWSFLNDYYQGRIDRSDLTGAQYEIAQCLDCGFIWQTQIPNGELMDRLYNIWISPAESLAKRTNAGAALLSGYAKEARIISSLLRKNPSEIDVLDFGMGWGYWCLAAKRLGYNVSGFEIAKERIAFARENGIKVIENFSAIAVRQFDFINAEQVFEHIPEPLQTLKTLVLSLKDKGIIQLSVPDGKGLEKKIGRDGWKPSKGPVQPLEHINCFTRQTLIGLAKRAGLEVAPLSLSLNSLFCPGNVLKQYYHQFFSTSLYFRKMR